jgi:hypothetical protein
LVPDGWCHRICPDQGPPIRLGAFDLPEWSLMQYAETTLAKLVLVARLHRKLDAIWGELGPGRDKTNLFKRFSSCRAIMLCLRGCCCSDLIKFHTTGRQYGFDHYPYVCQCRQVGWRRSPASL